MRKFLKFCLTMCWYEGQGLHWRKDWQEDRQDQGLTLILKNRTWQQQW